MSAIAVGIQLAAGDPDEFKAGPIGLLLLVLMGIAIIFLIRSMAKHLRKVPATFDRPKSDEANVDGPEEDTSADRADDDRRPTAS